MVKNALYLRNTAQTPPAMGAPVIKTRHVTVTPPIHSSRLALLCSFVNL